MVFAGHLLSLVQHWPVFQDNPELFILVPALLGLKGNLEMTLASRLSTAANTAKIDTGVMTANLALVQAQGIVVGALASLVPMAISHFLQNE